MFPAKSEWVRFLKWQVGFLISKPETAVYFPSQSWMLTKKEVLGRLLALSPTLQFPLLERGCPHKLGCSWGYQSPKRGLLPFYLLNNFEQCYTSRWDSNHHNNGASCNHHCLPNEASIISIGSQGSSSNGGKERLEWGESQLKSGFSAFALVDPLAQIQRRESTPI